MQTNDWCFIVSITYQYFNVARCGCIRFCGCVRGWAPVRGFPCLLWSETHTKGLCARFPTRPEEDEERKVPERVNNSRRKETVREMRLHSEESGPVDPEARSVSARGWVSVPSSCVGIFDYMLATDTEAQTAKKMPKTSPFLRLGLTQVRVCFFFFLQLSVIYVVSCVKQCEMLCMLCLM